jgi:transposase InsO family protein
MNPRRPLDNGWELKGSCYRSGLWHRACQATGTAVRKIRPYRPQTNGKVERFHRILLEERAYIRPWTSETLRANAYTAILHFYNHHRPHGALRWATPRTTSPKSTARLRFRRLASRG